MSDEKITLDLGIDDESPTLDLSKDLDQKVTVPAESGENNNSGNTTPEALSGGEIKTLDLSELGNTTAETGESASKASGGAEISVEAGADEPGPNDADGFVPVVLEDLPDQPVSQGDLGEQGMSEADYWDGAGDLFTGVTGMNQALSTSEGTDIKTGSGKFDLKNLDERQKKFLGIGVLVALLAGLFVMDPTLLDPILGGGDDYAEVEDSEDEQELDLVEEDGDTLVEDDFNLEEVEEGNEEAVAGEEVVDGELVANNDAEAPAEDFQIEDPGEEQVAAVDDADVNWQDNPYWNLPNHFAESIDKPEVTWTVEQEEAWRVNLESKFVWQKYKVLKEIRDSKLAGSEVLLWDLSKERKLWLRMKALMALAEFGEKSFN